MHRHTKDVSSGMDRSEAEESVNSAFAPSHALHGVLSAISRAPYSADSATELLAVLAAELGTSGCHVVVLESDASDGEGDVLVPLASAGQYGALLRDMPPIELDSPLEAAQVFRSGTPHFVDALHVPGEDSSAGTGRWRSMIATQSYAVLPLVIAGRAIGVLTLQWSTPVVFDDACRETLASVATASALAISLAQAGRHPQVTEGQPLSAHRCLDTVMLTAFGAPRSEGGTDPETVLTATLEVCGTGAVIFEHLELETAPARMLLVAPSMFGEALPEVASAVASAAVKLSASPAVWLDTLNQALPRGGTGVSAWAASFDPRSGVLIEASAGMVSTIVDNALGSEQQNEFKQLPLGLWSEEVYAERPRILLPGDTLEAAIDDGPDVTLMFLTRAPQA